MCAASQNCITAHCATRQLAQVPFSLFLPVWVNGMHEEKRRCQLLRTREKGIRKSASLAKHRPLQIIPYIADFISAERRLLLCVCAVRMCMLLSPRARSLATLEITNNSQPTQSLNLALREAKQRADFSKKPALAFLCT